MDAQARRSARVAGLLAAMALHGLLLAMPWPARTHQPPPRGPVQPPLQVMLLSEAVGRGARLAAPPAPAAAVGVRQAVLPPPALAVPAPVAPPPSLPDRAALPRTAPDLAPLLTGKAPSGLIRLRLHIAADGQVDLVEVIEAAPEDAAFAERLAELLRRTPHIPARRDGRDVASTKDVRIDFGVRTASLPPEPP